MTSQPLHEPTPTFLSLPLSQKTGKAIFLKMECYQPTGSFKIRGIGELCTHLAEQGIRHFVASSGGNAGIAVAYAAKQLGAKATVFVPTTTAPIFLHHLTLHHAEVKIVGNAWDEAHQAATEAVHKTPGAAYIPPFDHPLIWAGHSTLIDELNTQCGKPDAIIAAVGGGGLMCGLLEGMAQHQWHDVAVCSVETEGAASLAASIAANRLVTLPKIDTIATSLGAKRVAQRLFDWTQQRTITPLVVDDAAALSACRQFAQDHRVLVEPACGAALSVLYRINHFPALAEKQRIVVIVCGGIGIPESLFKV